MKWQDLPYDECTWETEEFLSDSKDEIARHEAEMPIVQDAQSRKELEGDDPQQPGHQRKRAKREDGRTEVCIL